MTGKQNTSRLLLGGLVIAVISFIAGTRIDDINVAMSSALGLRGRGGQLDLSSVQETYRQLKEHYDGQLDDAALIHGASRGLTDAAGDIHTAYLDPKEVEEFEKSMSGSIGGGIGAEIGLRNNRPTIVRPLKQSPAEKAGIKAGDVIVKINGMDVAGQTVDQVVAKIRGDVGTSVKLALLRGTESKEVAITRENVVAPAVEHEIVDDVGILSVHRFNDDTAGQARAAAEAMLQRGVRKVVLDLRYNPGGTVTSAQALAGLWLNNQEIMSERRGQEVVKRIHSVGRPVLEHMPTVVLINESSASASEIVAGALRDYGKAKLVGKKSYGKGSVQVLLQLNGGSQLKVTEARWYTAKGRTIDKTGIEPDETVELSSDDINNNRDPQLERAKTL